jgi:hypothetical protein
MQTVMLELGLKIFIMYSGIQQINFNLPKLPSSFWSKIKIDFV